MQYQLSDVDGDLIIVAPAESGGVAAKVAIVFIDKHEEDEPQVVMVLDDRLAADLKTAINLALQESERTG